jgi:prepilin-type N-terminal cleavage/methylation domain-containing protein
MRGRRAFTLIEVMVVIAIVGVLAALLLPALGRAKESGRKVTCASNLRQLDLAVLLYVDDHDGFLPPRTLIQQWPVQLLEYFHDLNLMRCPTESPPPAATNMNPSLEADTAPRSYLLNMFGDYFAAALSPAEFKSFFKGTQTVSIPESALPTASEIIFFGEKKSGRGEFLVDLNNNTLSSVVAITAQDRHHSVAGNPKSGGANHAYADGSVRYSQFGRSLCPINEWAVTDAGRTNLAICIYK